jgi:hypothetical protein
MPHGGALDFDLDEARSTGRAWYAANLLPSVQRQPVQVDASRLDYQAAYNSTSQAPSGPNDGVPLPYGRAWAEARSVTHSTGSGGVTVTLLSTQTGVRAIVTAPIGATIAGGSVRFWVYDPAANQWALGSVEETLATGTRAAATSDQFVTVGGR